MRSLRFVFISDTHARHGQMPAIPKGDVLIHTGDFTNVGDQNEILAFKEWFNTRPHHMKTFIAGNHELSLETSHFVREGFQRSRFGLAMTEAERQAWSVECRRIVSEPPSVYLEDSTTQITVNNGTESTILKVYGSPYQPEFCNWAFNLDYADGSLERKWAQIPSDTDILLTHGPPRSILDWNQQKDPCGCPFLANEVKNRIKPRIHAFGHLHDGYGTFYDGTTLYVNACTCTEQYRPTNPPIVVDLLLDKSLPPRVVPLEEQAFD